MIFHNETWEEFPYTMSGTSFLFCYKQLLFLVTADHVMIDRPATTSSPAIRRRGEEVQVHAEEDYSDSSLPFQYAASPIPSKSLPPVAADLYVLQIASKHCTDAQIERISRLDLDAMRPTRPPLPGQRLLVGGYPMERKYIDYDRKKFSHARVLCDPRYLEAAPGGTSHFMTFDPDPRIESFNGFSGSPVFSAHWNGIEYQPEAFEGVVIRASTDPGTVRTVQYIDSNVVYATLDKMTQPRAQTPNTPG
jgi:hypothetical protein